MKKYILIGIFAFIIGITFAETFPVFPMTIYGNIKIGDSLPESGTIIICNSLGQNLTTYEITEIGKYGSDNVQILPLLLNQFEGNLDIKLSYNGKTYIVDHIDDSEKGEICPEGSSINFVSANCKYNITLKEKTEDTPQGNGGSNGGSSGGKNYKNHTETNNLTNSGTQNSESSGNNTLINYHESANLDNIKNVNSDDNEYSEELNEAYKFAYKYGITTKNNIYEAEMDGYLTRIAAAKMLSQFAINILGKKPNTTETATFKDVSLALDSDYNNGVSLAYQLGIMGVNMDGYFRPYSNITRAEFGTALSRMLYGIEDGKDLYYIPHLNKLKEKGIIKDTNPDLIEIRGYAMLMLMRATNNITK